MKLSVDEVRQALLEVVGPEARPAEQRFAAKVRAHPGLMALRARRTARIVELVGGHDGVLLDAGAGTALNAVLALLAGARKVIAVELNPARFGLARKLSERLQLGDRLELVTEDLLSIELPPSSLDGVYSNEFLEHVVDSAGYHLKAAGWLKPGGRIYGRTGANGASWIYRLSYPKLWRDADERHYEPQRLALLAELDSALPADAAARLAKGTRGGDRAEIEAALAAFRRHGTFPSSNRRVPKNPATGVYHERLRTPGELLAEMAAAGLVGRVARPDFRHSFSASLPRRWAIRFAGALISATHPASLVVAPWLEVVGEKPAIRTACRV